MTLRRFDLGDLDLVFGLEVKGRSNPRLVWHWGVPRKATPQDRIQGPVPHSKFPYGKATRIMDLKADNSVTATPEFEDEEGNTVPAPADFTATYTTDRTDLVAITVNADNSVTFAAVGGVGNLGAAALHGEATFGGMTATMDDVINVVAGDAQRFSLKFGTPVETTPDV
jgi:hypothetical protein